VENALFYVGMNVTKPPFDNVKIRQAVAWAIPYDKIQDTALYGRGTKMWGAAGNVVKTTAWPQPTGYKTDIARARALMAEAGAAAGFEIEFPRRGEFVFLRVGLRVPCDDGVSERAETSFAHEIARLAPDVDGLKLKVDDCESVDLFGKAGHVDRFACAAAHRLLKKHMFAMGERSLQDIGLKRRWYCDRDDV
jgi:hypothetical protein